MNGKPRNRLRRWLIALPLIVIALPGGYYVARHDAWPAYKAWREAKLTHMAEKFMAAGDYDNALLTARQALRDNQRNVAHWRLAAAAAKAKGSTDAIFYQQNVARLDPSVASQLEVIRLALRFGDYRDAVETIENINPAAKDNSEFHKLAAEIYLGVGRPTAARLHLYSLISLEPKNLAAKLDLAEIELAEDSEGKNQKLRGDILALSREPELRTRALVMLLRDAVARHDSAQAVNVATSLRPLPGLTGEEQVLVLAGLSLGTAEVADDYRRQLQTEFAAVPSSVAALASYYRQSGPAAEARRWFDSLPPTTRADPVAREAIAGVYLEWKDWPRLDQTLGGESWKEREFIRQAFVAYSARKNGRFADAGNSWRLAVIQAGDSTRKISELLTLVAQWGWQTEQYDLVWKLFALMPRNESISRQLIAWERHEGHTANLNRIFARLAEFGSDDPMIKNNLAYTGLLLDANLSKAYELAQNNYRAEPENPYYVTTEAFALYKQNRPAEALALLEKLHPSALSMPERVMFHALFRASTGDATGAADLLSGLQRGGFLPEENTLITRTRTEIARLDRDKGDDLKLYALSNRGEIDHRKGWLQALPASVRASATVDMQTADSLYAIGDFAGFAAQLRKGAWGENEYLRFALIAYASRARGDEGGSRSYWRTALGTAGGNLDKQRQLEALATTWNWQPEKMELVTRLFEADPASRDTLAELLTYYRSVGRTDELVSVLSAYLSANPNDQAQRCELAYYRMLSGLDVTSAYVSAQAAYEAAPNATLPRLVYAFALWKQRRAPEAWQLLEKTSVEKTEVVPVELLRAVVLGDMERQADAATALKNFNLRRALPEETSLATLTASKLKEDARVSRLN